MKLLQHKLRGTGVALVTPFDTKGHVDLTALDRLVKHVLKGKCEYVVVMGTTGESVTLSLQERQIILSNVIRIVNGKIPVVLGVGGNDTATVLAGLKDYDLKGVDALLSVSPYYNKPSLAEETEIGGVIIPSASMEAPPMIAGIASHLMCILRTSAYKEKIPPSPLLSALRVRIMYLKVVCSVSVQNTQEILPKTSNSSMRFSFIMALITYNGEVPISPKIIPRVTSIPAAVTLL
jgi:hypothetical protein